MKKIIKYGAAGLAAAFAAFLVFGFLVLGPKEARTECNSKALDFISEEAKHGPHYSDQERDADYEFAFQACLRSRGYERL
jgi:hypothetical protein